SDEAPAATEQEIPEQTVPDPAPRRSESKVGELGMSGQMREMQMRRMMAGDVSTGPASYEAAPGGSVEAGEAKPGSPLPEVQQLGEQIAKETGPISEADKQSWVDAQAKLRKSVSDLAASVSSLPENAPERAAAKAKLGQMSEKLSSQELHVLARMDPEFGKS